MQSKESKKERKQKEKGKETRKENDKVKRRRRVRVLRIFAQSMSITATFMWCHSHMKATHWCRTRLPPRAASADLVPKVIT